MENGKNLLENENIIINEEQKSSHCLYKEWNFKLKCYKFCKFPICKNKNNLNYCGNHLPLGEEGKNGIIIKCKICNQNIGANIMETHLKKCNKNREKKYKEISTLYLYYYIKYDIYYIVIFMSTYILLIKIMKI